MESRVSQSVGLTMPPPPLLLVLLLTVMGMGPAAAGGEEPQQQPVQYQLQYTHPASGQPLHPHLRPSGSPPGQQQLQLRDGLLPCECVGYGCGCCAGLSMAYFNWSRTACLNMTYDPYEFALGVNLLMDDRSIFKNSISARNPPALCAPVPVPIPFLVPPIDLCVRLFNLFTPPPGLNLHLCLDFETRVSRAPVLVLEFDCLRMGSSGVYLLKPEDLGEVPGEVTTDGPDQGAQPGEDTYDEVTEDRRKNNRTQPTGA